MSYIFDDPTACAEDEVLRCSYAQRLIQIGRPSPAPASGSGRAIPKVLVQYWHDLTEIPRDVQECHDTWNSLASHGFERLLFEDRTARDFILREFGSVHARAYDLCYHPAMRCDYFRLCYILSCGGFYVDSDEIYQGSDCTRLYSDDRLKIQPLCHDTSSGTMVATEAFVRDLKWSPHWIFYFNNNPLVSPPGHPIIRIALERATRIILDSRERPEIQSTTGPGNLTASVVKHSIDQERSNNTRDFVIMPDWESVSITPWPLSYRDDARNWRLSNRKAFPG